MGIPILLPSQSVETALCKTMFFIHCIFFLTISLFLCGDATAQNTKGLELNPVTQMAKEWHNEYRMSDTFQTDPLTWNDDLALLAKEIIDTCIISDANYQSKKGKHSDICSGYGYNSTAHGGILGQAEHVGKLTVWLDSPYHRHNAFETNKMFGCWATKGCPSDNWGRKFQPWRMSCVYCGE